MATDLQRQHLTGLMRWLVAHEPLIDYAQHRPMVTRHWREQNLSDLFASHKHFSMDCSEAVTLLCRLAGLADPNGAGYDGSGFTGTLLGHLSHYSDPKRAHVGALVVYGPGSGDHVCMVLEPGGDPLVFSHGQKAGPMLVRHSMEKRAHRPPATFLDISHL